MLLNQKIENLQTRSYSYYDNNWANWVHKKLLFEGISMFCGVPCERWARTAAVL